MSGIVAFAESLARTDYEAVGFIPRPRLEHYAAVGQILVQTENDEPREEPPQPRRLGCLAALLAVLVLVLAPVPTPQPASAASGEAGTVLISGYATEGTWAYAKPSHGARYLAIPEGPGWIVQVCGPLDCCERVATDAGPELWLQRAGRIGDLSFVDFGRACGPLSAGLCRGSYTILGAADQHPDDPPSHPADDEMRVEDGGPAPTLPPTDMEKP